MEKHNFERLKKSFTPCTTQPQLIFSDYEKLNVQFVVLLLLLRESLPKSSAKILRLDTPRSRSHPVMRDDDDDDDDLHLLTIPRRTVPREKEVTSTLYQVFTACICLRFRFFGAQNKWAIIKLVKILECFTMLAAAASKFSPEAKFHKIFAIYSLRPLSKHLNQN